MFCILPIVKKITEFWFLDSEEFYLFEDQVYGVIKGVMSLF